MSFDAALAKAWLLLIPAGCAALGYLCMKFWRGMRRTVRLADDILGTPARPGVLSRLETITTTVDVLRKEVHPNNGKSLGEAVNEIRVMATEARQKAATAASEVEGLATTVARFHHDARERADVAGRERRGVQESLNVLLRALSEFADERHQRENAYVRALARLGIDLTKVTAELELEAKASGVDLRNPRDAR